MDDTNQEPQATTTQESQNTEDAATKYKARLTHFLADLDKKFMEEGVKTAAIVIIDPKTPERPLLYTIGHPFNVALSTCGLARMAKEELISSEELSV